MRGMISICLACLLPGAAVAAADPEPVSPPVIIAREILPLERPAPTEEVILAIDNCMEAVGPNRSLNLKRLNELGWKSGASKRLPDGADWQQYLRRNVLNDVSVLPRAVSCTTKAKLGNLSQVDQIREAMIAKYGLSRFDDYRGKDNLKRAMLKRFGDAARDTALFRDGNTFTVEITKVSFGNFVGITNIPDVTNDAQPAH